LNKLLSQKAGPTLTLGSVGIDARAGEPYLAHRDDKPYYYNIPSECIRHRIASDR